MRSRIGICSVAAILASCAGPQPALGPPTASRATSELHVGQGRSSNYAVLLTFDGTDGAEPSQLLDVNGTFYGTTRAGGTDANSCLNLGGCGTVFSITPPGKEKVLHEFVGGKNDGSEPIGTLIDVRGTLYGTTYSGGEGCQDSLVAERYLA